MRTKAYALIGVMTAVFIVSAEVRAQDAPQYLSVLTVDVKPGFNAQFEEFAQKFRDAANESDSPQYWRAVSSVTGGERYVFTTPFGSFVELSMPGPELVKVYGEEEAARLLSLFQESATNMSSTIYVQRPDLSHSRSLDAPPAAVLYIDLNVRFGREADFEAYVKKVIEATEATAPENYWSMQQRVFGPGTANGVYRVAVAFPEWADLDPQPKPIPERLREHFGDAEADRLEAQIGEILVDARENLNRVRADLARLPPE